MEYLLLLNFQTGQFFGSIQYTISVDSSIRHNLHFGTFFSLASFPVQQIIQFRIVYNSVEFPFWRIFQFRTVLTFSRFFSSAQFRPRNENVTRVPTPISQAERSHYRLAGTSSLQIALTKTSNASSGASLSLRDCPRKNSGTSTWESRERGGCSYNKPPLGKSLLALLHDTRAAPMLQS